MASAGSADKQVRVMMWAPPRSLSTAFQKCMSFVDGVQIINEPYQSAATNNPEVMKQLAGDGTGPGAEARQKAFDTFMESTKASPVSENLEGVGWDDSVCTPAWIKNLLEGPFPGKKVVFAKDLIFGIKGQYPMIPKGYQHTFLIRNPTKMLISIKKNLAMIFPVPEGQELSLLMMPPLFRELCQPLLQLIDYLKESKEIAGNPIIIDADDLQNHPASILRQYCAAVGIPYTDSLLEWPAGDDCVKKNWLVSKTMLQGDTIIGYYAGALASTKFTPAKPVPENVAADIVEVAKTEEPFYKQLYDMRIKP